MDYPEEVDSEIDPASREHPRETQVSMLDLVSSEGGTDTATSDCEDAADRGAHPAKMADPASAPPLPDTLPDTDRNQSEAAELLQGVADELERAHRLSLDLQGVFSRSLGEMAAHPELIRDAQDLDRLSQIIENLARLLHLIAESHPAAPRQGQVEACLTLEALETRLAGSQGRCPAVSPERSDALPSAEGSAAQARADRRQGLSSHAEGDISWL